jgi:hypothetical protein
VCFLNMASSKHWTTEPDREVNIKRVFSGVAAVKPKTVFEVCLGQCHCVIMYYILVCVPRF